MNNMNLNDNALFMRFWFPQRRPGRAIPIIGGFAMLMVAAVVCWYLVYLERLVHIGETVRWARWCFLTLYALDSGMLLLIGSYMVGAAAYIESSSGGLDFHRTSSTPSGVQFIGLLLGPAALTWICFFLSLPVMLICLALSDLSWVDSLSALMALPLTALFYHTITVAVGLTVRKPASGAASAQQATPMMVVFLACFGFSGMGLTPAALPGFLSNLPAAAVPFLEGNARIGRIGQGIPHAFFGLPFPVLVTQLLVQAPLAMVALWAALRVLRRPGRPAMSKRLAAMLTGWLLLLFVAGTVGADATGERSWIEPMGAAIAGALFLLVLGLAVLSTVTPRYIYFANGLRRRHEGFELESRLLGDSASNVAWCGMYALQGIVFYLALWFLFATPWLPLVAVLLVIGWMSQAVEYFRLRPEKRKSPVLGLLIGALWVVIPGIGGVMAISQEQARVDIISGMLMSPCPLFDVIFLSIPPGQEGVADTWLTIAIFAIGVNALLLLLFAGAARRARRRVAAAV